MNVKLNYNIDFVFVITPHILLKHNNYLYQNLKIDNYFIETQIYDHTDPLNVEKNYYFTLQKILKIAILRKYNNIMVIQSDILFKNNWMNILNSILTTELGIINDNFGVIWLQSEQEYFTDYQLNEITHKQYYRFNLTYDRNNNNTVTCGNDGLIISHNVYGKLYSQIKHILHNIPSHSETNLETSLTNVLSNICFNTNSFIIYPNLIINTKKLEPLCQTVQKILLNKEKKYVNNNNFNYLNSDLKKIVTETYNASIINKDNNSNIDDLNYLKELTNKDVIDELYDENLLKIYTDYIVPYKIMNNIYNPNHFNVYYSFNKDVMSHFDWLFYKHYYDDLINNDAINSFEDAMYHYISYGYRELRFICIDEYLYDKNDNELEENIKLIDINSFYKINKTEIDEKYLSKKPIIYYIKYVYNHITVV